MEADDFFCLIPIPILDIQSTLKTLFSPFPQSAARGRIEFRGYFLTCGQRHFIIYNPSYYPKTLATGLPIKYEWSWRDYPNWPFWFMATLEERWSATLADYIFRPPPGESFDGSGEAPLSAGSPRDANPRGDSIHSHRLKGCSSRSAQKREHRLISARAGTLGRDRFDLRVSL